MTQANLPLDSFLAHLGELPRRLPVPQRPAGEDARPGGSAIPPDEAALALDLGAPWEGYGALSARARRLAAFLVAGAAASQCPDPCALGNDLAAGTGPDRAGDAAAMAACEALGERHAYVATVFRALFEARGGHPLPAYCLAGLEGAEPAIHAVAIDAGRRTRDPAAIAARFHHRLEARAGRRIPEPRFRGLAALLADRAGHAP